MRRTCLVTLFVLLVVLLFTGDAMSYEIFLWQHDNGLLQADPVLRQSITATEAVARTLNTLDIDYVRDTELPDNLEEYDVVITCLSFYCPG